MMQYLSAALVVKISHYDNCRKSTGLCKPDAQRLGSLLLASSVTMCTVSAVAMLLGAGSVVVVWWVLDGRGLQHPSCL